MKLIRVACLDLHAILLRRIMHFPLHVLQTRMEPFTTDTCWYSDTGLAPGVVRVPLCSHSPMGARSHRSWWAGMGLHAHRHIGMSSTACSTAACADTLSPVKPLTRH